MKYNEELIEKELLEEKDLELNTIEKIASKLVELEGDSFEVEISQKELDMFLAHLASLANM